MRLRRLPQRRPGSAIIGLFMVALPGSSKTLGSPGHRHKLFGHVFSVKLHRWTHGKPRVEPDQGETMV